MKSLIPKVAAIHDLSGFGRCSLTVIIPVLSAMGIQACPLPTAILSTHSGGFDGFVFHDLTQIMEPYGIHWMDQNIEFDCLYSGFLGSEEQIDHMLNLFKYLKTKDEQLVVVDPVMADNGVLYKTYNIEMQKGMALLVKKADVITPNLTEAYFLLNRPYINKPLDDERIKELLKSLSDIGPETVVITSLETTDGCNVNVGYNKTEDLYWKVAYDHVPVSYPGTGDIFTSVLIGGLLDGNSLPLAMDRATQFVSLAVRTTFEYGGVKREGVLLERVLPWLINELTHNSYTTIS